jgi:nitroreductase
MKQFDDIIRERRSVRRYLDRPVEQEKLRAVIEAARLAPSACNAQPWRFVAVTEKQTRERLLREGLGGAVPNTWAQTAPCVVVACSDLQLFTHTLGETVQGVHYHLIDLGIALEHLVLKATELGLGSCYIGWFRGKQIARVLDLPGSWKAECLVTLGYPESVPEASPRKPLEEIAVFK